MKFMDGDNDEDYSLYTEPSVMQFWPVYSFCQFKIVLVHYCAPFIRRILEFLSNHP